MINLFKEPILPYFLIAFFAFLAGLIDAVVGGGGLVQLPAVLINFPNLPITSIYGSNKFSALIGTSSSAFQFAKKIVFNKKIIAITGIFAAIGSFLGAKTTSYIDNASLKPFILLVLIGISIYTFLKKDLGQNQSFNLPTKTLYWRGLLMGLGLGFYDGIFGPGTGSFLVLCFVSWLGFDFLHASAYAKVVNCITNLAALIYFLPNKAFIPVLAIILATFNLLGNLMGTKIALKHGNGLIRKVFLMVLVLLILRFAYDIFLK